MKTDRNTRTALQDVVCEGLFDWVCAHGHDVGASLLGAQDVDANYETLATQRCLGLLPVNRGAVYEFGHSIGCVVALGDGGIDVCSDDPRHGFVGGIIICASRR